jgi:hypothetical protein
LKLDREIVDQIKKCIPLNHEYIVEPAKRAAIGEQIKRTVAKNTIGTHGRWLLPYYLQFSSQENSLHIRGNSYGVYKLAWLPLNNNDTLDDLKKQYFRLTKNDHPHESPKSREKQFVNGIERWEYSNRQFDYHRSELLFWELRLGRWASEIYNETDIAFNSLEPTNVRRMLEIATSFTYSQKRSKLFQSELVNDAYPLLNFPGKNDLRNLYEQIRDRDSVVLDTQLDDLHGSETLHALQPVAVVTLEDGTRTEMKLPAGEIKIPAEHFRPGRSTARSFVPSEFEGDLTFTVNNPYSNPKARGTWKFEVLVDDELKFRWDGADRHRPVHVFVHNLQAGMCVTLRQIVLRDQQGKTSWERASRATITSSIAQQRPVRGQVVVVADIVSERVP